MTEAILFCLATLLILAVVWFSFWNHYVWLDSIAVIRRKFELIRGNPELPDEVAAKVDKVLLSCRRGAIEAWIWMLAIVLVAAAALVLFAIAYSESRGSA